MDRLYGSCLSDSRRCRNETLNLFDAGYRKRNIHHISQGWGFVAVAITLLLGFCSQYHFHENLPKALDNSELLHNPNSFLSERAWHDLKILSSFGSRSVGKYTNEVLAIEFLKKVINNDIKNLAHANQRVELDVQVVSGGFWADFKPYGMTSIYRNVQNVVVKLHGEPGLRPCKSLLINAHFDSVPGSPGASDDAMACAVMLEILRVLSRQSNRSKCDIIFLFNGAEETGLQASHGFITKHKWAKNIGAFINLESVGSGGKEMLFQSSANNSWLVAMYGKSVPHPNAQAAAEEIFQSGIIPSDTDFRIFRDFGKLPGMDFAHHINSHRYHTKYDHIDYIPIGSVQHTGDNILELAKAISNGDELRSTKKKNINQSQVFFDIFGYFFIVYSKDFATVFNYVVVVSAVSISYLSLSKATKGINKKHLRYEIFLGFVINMISLVSAGAFCYAIAYDVDVSGQSMFWYSNTYLCVPTYCLVTVFVQCAVHLVFSRNLKTPLSLALQTQARLAGTSLFWGILCAAGTGAGVRTSYTIMVPIFITNAANMVIAICDYQNSQRRWLYVHLFGQLFVVLWSTLFYSMVLGIFIPTAGRMGGEKNPDIIISIICCCLTFFITSYLTPLVVLLERKKTFLISLFTVYIITRFYFIAFTNVGFPYSDDTGGQPRTQRHYMSHTIRTLYDRDGNIRYTDSGIWMLNMDRNSQKTIESLIMPEEPIPNHKNILCKSEAFCGLPIYSIRQAKTGGFWIPSPMPTIREISHLELLSHQQLSDRNHRLNFALTGSYLASLQIHLRDNVSLKQWSLTTNLPSSVNYNKKDSYFVLITTGLESEAFNITIDVETAEQHHKRALLDITLVSTYFDYHKDHTSIFAKIISKLPRWAHVVPSVASLKSWTF
ncbi:endoplasmic reticulum metallopeptidase 1-like [Drosophila tropicalis]|uniref:endoplasmic reticulum metallopeptidase 1-like n=1 Tax=Drosophila tropicalis TaxID=46794 RepID=UPI0035ABAC15